MRFLLLIYIDPARLAALPESDFDAHMRDCLGKVDLLRAEGRVLDSQQLEPVSSARTLRHRDDGPRISDGPFAETREFLAGYNLVEADSIEDAFRIAESMPWTRFGAIEVRPVGDMEAMRARVGAPAA